MKMTICTRNSLQYCLKVQFLFSLVFVFALPMGAKGIELDDLYVAEMLVTDESPRQLRSGARAGLLQVLVRVSGDVRVEDNPLVRSSLRRPTDYYYQFSYENTDRQLLVNGQQVPARMLRLHFEPSAVARLLRQANLPVWGSNRPAVLFWIATNEGGSRRILGEADASTIVAGLNEQSRRRGLPVMFPILDLEDAAQITTAEVWGAFLERVENASLRYQPEAILTARVQEETGRWTGRWSYDIGGNWRSTETVAFSADELVRQMIDQIADELASRYALGSSRDAITVVVEGVRSLDDYAALSDYLEQLTPVLNSSVTALQQDVARFDLKIEGQAEQLVKIIELDERLMLLNQNPSGNRLMYRWKNI